MYKKNYTKKKLYGKIMITREKDYIEKEKYKEKAT